jgi:concentrative nucleoside transporter, CNT family
MDNLLFLRITSAIGLVAMIGLAWVLSENRRKVDWRLVLWGVGLQFVFAVIILRTAAGPIFFDAVKSAFDVLTDSTKEGAKFVFGTLPENREIGAVVAFQVLPVIIFVSALSAILEYLGVIQIVIRAIAYVMRRTMKTSGAETFGAALQVFMGIETLPALRSYMNDMPRSELYTVMTTFMASIAASVMVAYAMFGAEPGHLFAASLMSAPAAILISKVMVPEVGVPKTNGATPVVIPVQSRNVVDAAARGASDGLTLALNVGAMLIAFIGLVYMADVIIRLATGWTTERPLTQIMGWVFRPFAFLMGVPLSDVGAVGALLGKKTVLNEFLAYADFTALKPTLSPRSLVIATYALCGFANPGSLGILIGAMTSMVPERRDEIINLGLKSLIAGTLSTFMMACIAGILIGA